MSDVDTADDGALVAPVETQDRIEQAPVQSTTPEQVETPTEDKARDEKGRFVPQERVNEITRARRDAERGLEAERIRAAQLEQELQQYRQQPAKQVTQSGAPKIEDYDFDLTAWSAAVVEHANSQAKSLVAEEFSSREAQRNHQSAAENFASRSEAYAKENPTYAADLAAVDEVIKFPQETIDLVYGLDNAPAVAHFIAKDFDLADRISRMSPVHAALEIGRLQARLASPKSKPVSNAPTPTPSVGGGSTAAARDPARMTDAEWLAAQSKSR